MDMKHGGNVWIGGKPGPWLDFSANLRPEGPPDWVKSVMAASLDHARYYPDRAMAAAREGLAAYAGVPAECILPTAGGAAAIDLIMSRRWNRVLIDPPTFGEYAERAMTHSLPVCHAQDTAVQVGDLRVICNPNNPTGSVLSPEEMLSLHAQVRHSGGFLLVDEAFIDYCPEYTVRPHVQAGLMVVGSLTKILCIPGVRLGYICAEPHVIDRLSHAALPWQLNMLASAIAAELPHHLDEMHHDAEINRLRREKLACSLTALGASVSPSHANFLLAAFPHDMTHAAERLRAQGILVRTCESFGLPGHILRLAVRTEEENARLMEALWNEC